MENKMIDGVKVAGELRRTPATPPYPTTRSRPTSSAPTTSTPMVSWESLTVDVDGEDVGIHYGLAPVKFDRIRRITGYLVGTLDRFNDAKRAEEHDRVKHEVPACCK